MPAVTNGRLLLASTVHFLQRWTGIFVRSFVTVPFYASLSLSLVEVLMRVMMHSKVNLSKLFFSRFIPKSRPLILHDNLMPACHNFVMTSRKSFFFMATSSVGTGLGHDTPVALQDIHPSS